MLLSAHLDHVGIGDAVNGDAIYNGAMDNASGVATLLVTSRMLRDHGVPGRSVVFLACTGEEQGPPTRSNLDNRAGLPMRDVVADDETLACSLADRSASHRAGLRRGRIEPRQPLWLPPRKPTAVQTI